VKYSILLLCFLFSVSTLFSQQKGFNIIRIHLPEELSYYDNQFSGLQMFDNHLYLLSESRIQDGREARLYTISSHELEQAKKDSSYQLSYKKQRITGLEKLAEKMKAEGQVYEGLEAMYIYGNSIYLSVETNTPSPFCYLLKGYLNNDEWKLTDTLLKIKKPRKADGESIYNAGFEAITLMQNRIWCFYEYNYFDDTNEVVSYDTSLNATSKQSTTLNRLPFRITDITPSGDHFIAINYFYKGEGDDTVYRLPVTDSSYALTQENGRYRNYCRLIDVQYKNGRFSWHPLWQLPAPFMSYNWEGIATDNKGFYLMNDKYTPARPYSSVLLYLEQKQ